MLTPEKRRLQKNSQKMSTLNKTFLLNLKSMFENIKLGLLCQKSRADDWPAILKSVG